MHIVILVSEIQGGGDRAFGLKLARFFLNTFTDAFVNLIIAKSDIKNEQKDLQHNNYQSFLMPQERVHVILYPYSVHGTVSKSIPQQSNTNLQNINWDTVGLLIFGPGYGNVDLISQQNDNMKYLRYEVIINNWDKIRKIPIYMISEYSFSESEFFFHQLKSLDKSLKIFHVPTGLAGNERGIFIDPSLSDQLESDIELIVRGMDEQLSIMKEDKSDDKSLLCIKNILQEFFDNDLVAYLNSRDHISIFYDSDNRGTDFDEFYNFHMRAGELNSYASPLVIAISNFDPRFVSGDMTISNDDEAAVNNVFLRYDNVIFLNKLNFDVLQACFRFASKNPGFGGCTGDQTLSESLSAGLIPVYLLSGASHKRDLAKSLYEIYKFIVIDDDFDYDSSSLSSDSLLQMSKNVKSIQSSRNLFNYLTSVFSSYFPTDSTSVSNNDKDNDEDFDDDASNLDDDNNRSKSPVFNWLI